MRIDLGSFDSKDDDLPILTIKVPERHIRVEAAENGERAIILTVGACVMLQKALEHMWKHGA